VKALLKHKPGSSYQGENSKEADDRMNRDFLGWGRELGTALDAALRNGHDEIVQLLLEAQQKAGNQPAGLRDSDVYHAAFIGDSTRVWELLMFGDADPSVEGGTYGTALHAASAMGHTSIIKILLLDERIDVNSPWPHHGSALQAAASGGRYEHRESVMVLLSHGADVNLQGGWFGNPLQAAALGGDSAILNMLLQEGANVNASGGHYGSALQAACHRGDVSIVERLLICSARVNAEGGVYGSALHAAATKGHHTIAKMLICRGARLDIRDRQGRTPEQVAGEDSNMVSLLQNGDL
jgi:ankyrin repeat domain-containing protein 50